jgi:hypothetical protein
MRLRSGPAGHILGFDLENRPLAYWFDGETTSEITAFSWKWTDSKRIETMLLCPDGSFDYDGCKVEAWEAYLIFRTQLSTADLTFGHNIRRHDLPMLNAGLIRLSLPTLKPILTSDTCRDLPRRKGLSYSLENMVSMYGIKGGKYTMSQPMWEDANRLTDTGLALARKRVTSDVLLQEKLRARLLELGILGAPKRWTP